MVAPDATTYAYLQGRAHAPAGADWDDAVAYWETLATDEGAEFDAEVFIDADALEPFVTWGTNPGQGVSLSDSVPDPAAIADQHERAASTSNRNFEGRQGRGGRTHLVSPQVAAATAVVGRLAAPADL